MSNIFNHNRNIFDFKLDLSNYWDFHICLENDNGNVNVDNICAITDIDFNDNECIWFDSIMSKPFISWSKATNNGIELNSIGYTGLDNGLITFDKYQITNKEFIDLYTKSVYTINKDDKRLILHKVDGNNQIYDYSNNIIYDDDIQVCELKGGFYQGFFKTDENYQILPTSLDEALTLTFELKKSNLDEKSNTLNKKHPKNKGIFFYIGTRSENKWYEYYKTDIKKDNTNEYISDDYGNEFVKNFTDTDEYVKKDIVEKSGDYFADDYINNTKDESYFDEDPVCNKQYVNNDYVENDIDLTDVKLMTEEGYDINQPNIIEYKTNNKFITFNRTDNGFTTKDDVDDTQVILYDIKRPKLENYFTLFHRGKDCFTTENIDDLINEKNKDYSILDDIYRNALCFQIKDDGSIGYKYLIKDCETNSYKIENEFSVQNIINEDKWYKIKIKIVPLYKKMKIFFYVNDKLILVSKELEELNLRNLSDLYSKQEGVPYNISIGGGTQGLCDMVNLNYMIPPSIVLPLEKEFAGSFIGYIKSFKISYCS